MAKVNYQMWNLLRFKPTNCSGNEWFVDITQNTRKRAKKKKNGLKDFGNQQCCRILWFITRSSL